MFYYCRISTSHNYLLSALSNFYLWITGKKKTNMLCWCHEIYFSNNDKKTMHEKLFMYSSLIFCVLCFPIINYLLPQGFLFFRCQTHFRVSSYMLSSAVVQFILSGSQTFGSTLFMQWSTGLTWNWDWKQLHLQSCIACIVLFFVFGLFTYSAVKNSLYPEYDVTAIAVFLMFFALLLQCFLFYLNFKPNLYLHHVMGE